MTCFLTSSPMIPGFAELNPKNRFIEELEKKFSKPCHALFVAAYPDDFEKTAFIAESTQTIFEKAGFRFDRFSVLDDRNWADTEALVRDANLMILSGGHVPTQNRFFQKIGLRKWIAGFPGVVIGISAGSMNSADVVYAQPEEAGEAIDPTFQRYLTGLNLTKTMLLPHYQMVKDNYLDGLRLFEDITFSDSMGKSFYVLPDGSYLFIENGKEEIRGEAYLIRDGSMSKIAENGETVVLR